jgi:hypothetical protein
MKLRTLAQLPRPIDNIFEILNFLGEAPIKYLAITNICTKIATTKFGGRLGFVEQKLMLWCSFRYDHI